MQLIVGISLVVGAFSFGPERVRHHRPNLERMRSRVFSRMATSIPQVRSEEWSCVEKRRKHLLLSPVSLHVLRRTHCRSGCSDPQIKINCGAIVIFQDKVISCMRRGGPAVLMNIHQRWLAHGPTRMAFMACRVNRRAASLGESKGVCGLSDDRRISSLASPDREKEGGGKGKSRFAYTLEVIFCFASWYRLLRSKRYS